MIAIARLNKLNKLNICIIPILSAFFNVIIILFPQTVLISAKEGLLLWFNKVIPSLLPFLIGTGLLSSLGFCSFLGVLFSPLMRKLFKIRGEGAYALAIGMTSGCPLGAKTVCELRQNGVLNKNEAQRLLGFVNNSGPLFILGTAASSMLMCPKAGYVMLIIQYVSAFLTGIFLSFFRNSSEHTPCDRASLGAAVSALVDYRQKHTEPFGKILSDSIKSSVETILQIGGFIVLFSVLAKILSLAVGIFTSSLYINGSLVGILEMTNASAVFAKEKNAFSAVLMTAFISWGGLSIHAQSIAMISKTDLSPSLYVLSKLVHGIIAFITGIILMPVFSKLLSAEQTFAVSVVSAPSLFKASASGFVCLIAALAAIPVFLLAAVKLFLYSQKLFAFLLRKNS